MAKITRKDAVERITEMLNGRTQMTMTEFKLFAREVENNVIADMKKSLRFDVVYVKGSKREGFIGTSRINYATVEIVDEFTEKVAQQLEDEDADQDYLDAVDALINEEPKTEAEAPAKKSTRKGPRATYIFYYTDKNGDGNGYEVYGTQGFYDALKFLHSAEVKATRIEIYKKGPNFENDHEDVSRAHTKYWK